ncbi:MAG TPA: flippase-like domain-containing protein [Nitrospirae bacterium]|nr:flippase-like domain-containing protein [Nitrospirota bacterium]
MASSKRKIVIPAWLRFFLSAAIIAFLFKKVDITHFSSIVSQAIPGWLLAGLCLIFLEQLAVSIAWRAMLASKGYKVPFWKMLHIIIVSNFIGFVFPSTAGADVVRVLGLSKYISSASDAFSSMVIFRVSGYVLMFTIALISATFFAERLPDDPVIKSISVALVIGFAILFLALLFSGTVMRLLAIAFRKIGKERLYLRVETLYRAFSFYLGHKGAMTVAFAGALFMQLERILYVYVVSLALGLKVDPATLCLFVPIIMVLTLIPVSISGIGVREGGFVFLFGYAGLSAAQAMSLSICGFALSLVYVLLGGLVYWLFGFPGGESVSELKGKEPAV